MADKTEAEWEQWCEDNEATETRVVYRAGEVPELIAKDKDGKEHKFKLKKG